MKQGLLGAGLCALLFGLLWMRQPEPATQLRHEAFAMGTLVQISVLPVAGTEHAHRAIDEAMAVLQDFDLQWSPRGDGMLGQLNQQLAHSTHARPVDALLPDLQGAVALCRASGGRFDPAIGALVRLWGFDDELNFREQPPSPAEILSTPRGSLCTARISNGELHFDLPGVQLDFGGSAKGRAVALAIASLRASGIESAIVNAGGDLQVIGDAGGRAWRVGLRHPRAESSQTVIAALELTDGEAVFTSGDYERWFEYEGRRYHHILDPRSAYPAINVRSATVLSTDPWLADAASTALFVAAGQDAAAVMAALGIDDWLLIDDLGQPQFSPGMGKRLEWRQ